MHHVAVGDDVVLALEPHFAGIAGADLAAIIDIIVIADRFGPNEAALEVGMDDGCGRRRLGAACDGPSGSLFGAGGELGDQIEKRIAGPDQAIEARLLEAHGA